MCIFYLQAAFFVDWDKPCVSKDGTKRSTPKSDFAIKLDMFIEAHSKTGYVATVKRAIDCVQR
jgi:hypothetical protein